MFLVQESVVQFARGESRTIESRSASRVSMTVGSMLNDEKLFRSLQIARVIKFRVYLSEPTTNLVSHQVVLWSASMGSALPDLPG